MARRTKQETQKQIIHDLDWYRSQFKTLIGLDRTYEVCDLAYNLLLNMALEHDIEDRLVKRLALKVGDYFKSVCLYNAADNTNPEQKAFDDLYWLIMKFEAGFWLDSYCLYIEKNRPLQEQFYQPRRKTLKKVVDMFQRIEDDELDEMFLHMPPRVGKTGITTMAVAWHCCRDTEASNLYVTYKEDAGGAFVDGVLELMTDPTYCHTDVFPQAKIVQTNAKAHTMDLERKKKYKSLSGKGLDSGLNGLYDARGWLLIDDPLEGIADVLNPDVLRRKQTIFDNNVLSRRKGKAKIIYIGTIWSLRDIFMNRYAFLEANAAAKNVRVDRLKLPALDPITDESNFDYDYDTGFSTEYYRMVRAKFEEENDAASWQAQFMQEPIEREGAMFNYDNINTYNGILPDEEPLKIVAACDVALGGLDFLSMPIAYVYEDGSTYIHDLVFDNNEKHVTLPRVVDALIRNHVTNVMFEANSGGEGYKDEVDAALRDRGIRVNIQSKFAQQMVSVKNKQNFQTAQRKAMRIWDRAQEIRNFYYRDQTCQSLEYRKFMSQLFSFTVEGKNKHDDAPDSLSMLAYFLDNGSGVRVSRIINSPV